VHDCINTTMAGGVLAQVSSVPAPHLDVADDRRDTCVFSVHRRIDEKAQELATRQS